MIAVTGHHVALCCPFCEHELHAGDPPVCLNGDCWLFGYPAPLPEQRMVKDGPRQGLPRGGRRTMNTGPK